MIEQLNTDGLKEPITQTKETNDIIVVPNKEIIKPNTAIHKTYENRDMSWLKFNNRIIDMSLLDEVPILERFKFINIAYSNLDEFNMIRYSRALSNSNPSIKLESVKKLRNSMNGCLDRINAALKYNINLLDEKYNIIFLKEKKDINKKGMKYLHKYFTNKIYPLLTPFVVDNVRPFPKIINNTNYMGIIINDNGNKVFAIMQIPNINRVIEIEKNDNQNIKRELILLEDLIKINLNKIFIGKKIEKVCTFRILRDLNDDSDVESDVFIADRIKEKLERRQIRNVIRLDITGNKKEFTGILYKAMDINKSSINKSNLISDPSFLMDLYNINLNEKDTKTMKYDKFKPTTKDVDIYDLFDKISDNDIILHHPYDSYETVIEFITKASEDKNVVAIKQTLYRVTKNSPIVKALANAAKNGKHVTVLLEIKARFDEANNLKMANILENAGANVIYGVPKMKTHCKLCLVVRKNKKGNLDSFVHIGTGNYNEKNSEIYTDLSLFTNKEEITDDINSLFNYITGASYPKMKNILFSPVSLYTEIINLINNEIENHKKGLPSGINIKINSLTDKSIVDKLYEAGNVGVKVNLIVRGACSIRSTENITIKSIVGRFLEHSRIYHFVNNNEDKYFISSADLMERNLYYRIELLIPIVSKNIKEAIKNILNIYLDDSKCFIMNNDGIYKYVNIDMKSSQEIFIDYVNDSNVLTNNKLFSREKKDE